MARETSFSLPVAIYCEGYEDKVFLCRLLEQRQLGRCHVLTTATEGLAAGNSRFGGRLRLDYLTNRGFHHVRRILIITDGDGDNDAAFINICNQIATAGMHPPAVPDQFGGGVPSILVHVVDGNLECLLQPAARSRSALIAGHVDTFRDFIASTQQWRDDQLGKLWLRSCLAANCPRDPFVTLGKVFTEPRYYDIAPTNHPSLDGLSAIIEGLFR